MYEYRAKIMRVVDGDTFDVIIDLGFFRQIGQEAHRDSWARIRLLGQLDNDSGLEGVDAYETRLGRGTTPGMKILGKKGAAMAEELCGGQWVKIRTERAAKGSLGRWLAAIELPDGRDLGRVLFDAGLAVEWKG